MAVIFTKQRTDARAEGTVLELTKRHTVVGVQDGQRENAAKLPSYVK